MKLATFLVLFAIGLLWVALAFYLAAHAVPQALCTRDTLALAGLPPLALVLWVGGSWSITRRSWAIRLGGAVLLLGAGWLSLLLVGAFLMYTATSSPTP